MSKGLRGEEGITTRLAILVGFVAVVSAVVVGMLYTTAVLREGLIETGRETFYMSRELSYDVTRLRDQLERLEAQMDRFGTTVESLKTTISQQSALLVVLQQRLAKEGQT